MKRTLAGHAAHATFAIQRGSRWIANVACAAWPASVRFIAEMAYQSGHPALAQRGVAHHLFELLRAIPRLYGVSLFPARTAAAHISDKISARATVDLQLLKRFV